jgi:hypothetical protein
MVVSATTHSPSRRSATVATGRRGPTTHERQRFVAIANLARHVPQQQRVVGEVERHAAHARIPHGPTFGDERYDRLMDVRSEGHTDEMVSGIGAQTDAGENVCGTSGLPSKLAASISATASVTGPADATT